MPNLSLLGTPSPYHVLIYGTLLGAQFFETFISGIVAYKVLPKPQFSNLQRSVFPIYFVLHASSAALLVLTYPTTPSGLGVFDHENYMHTVMPLVTVFSTALANLLVVGPATSKIMKARQRQGKPSLFIFD
jgi:hypothetical protein